MLAALLSCLLIPVEPIAAPRVEWEPEEGILEKYRVTIASVITKEGGSGHRLTFEEFGCYLPDLRILTIDEQDGEVVEMTVELRSK